MRGLERNKQTIYYSLYKGKAPVVDADGFMTSEYTVQYDDPVEYRINVSAAKGEADLELFGITTGYTKVMVTTDIGCPIDEKTILWVDANPETDEHNFVVVKKAKSLNSIAYAIREVEVHD